MKGIEINGIKLHEIGLYQTPHAPGVIVTLRYPKQNIKYSFELGRSFVEVPSLLAVELYRGGIISQKKDEHLIIKESGRNIGTFIIKKVIYPNSCSHDGIRFELERTNE